MEPMEAMEPMEPMEGVEVLEWETLRRRGDCRAERAIRVLGSLAPGQGITAAELASVSKDRFGNHSGLTAANASRTLRLLASRRLVNVEPRYANHSGMRAMLYSLTGKGRQFYALIKDKPKRGVVTLPKGGRSIH